jgi:3-oxoacyl-[acyl-carrier protein] reductase
MTLGGKVAVVVGGGTGIGRATAALFAAEGARVAVELVADSIRVNVVAPGTIDTDAGGGIPEFRRRMLDTRIPIRRPGHVDDVAHACLYLASDAARYVTGSILAVDGGWTAS